MAGAEDAMVLAQQFLARVFADGAELVVYVGDGSLHVGGGNNGMLVEGELLIGQFLLDVPVVHAAQERGHSGSALAERGGGQRRGGDPRCADASCRSAL